MQLAFRNKEELFNHLGISIRDNEGQYRKTYDVLKDLAEAWEHLDEVQQEYYAQALFKLF